MPSDVSHFSFKKVNEPLLEIIKEITKGFNRVRVEDKDYSVLNGIFLATFQTYKAILVLLDAKRSVKYPTQAYILVRSIIDALFNMIFILENPNEYAREFYIAGFNAIKNDFENEEILLKNEKNSEDYIERKRTFLKKFERVLAPTDTEKKFIWPIPSKIKNRTSEKDKLFLERVYKNHYHLFSEGSHFAFVGVSMSNFSISDDTETKDSKNLESIPALYAIMFLLMISSEIESHLNFGVTRQLRYLWNSYGKYFPFAKYYFNMRYDALLKKNQ